MDIVCPSCQYVRKENSHPETPEWRCPACEIVYEKYEKNISKMNELSDVIAERQATEEAASPTETPTPKPCHDTEPSKLALLISDYLGKFKVMFKDFLTAKGGLIILVVFILGFFTGREYFRYEVRSAIQDTFQNVGQILGGESKGKPLAHDLEPRKESKLQDNLPVEITNKGYELNSDSDYDDKITFTLYIKNPYKKDIRAFNGLVVFTDILDNKVKNLNLAFKDGIIAGDTISWDGEMEYNPFIDSDKKLRRTLLKDIKVKIFLKKVIFTDGSIEDF